MNKPVLMRVIAALAAMLVATLVGCHCGMEPVSSVDSLIKDQDGYKICVLDRQSPIMQIASPLEQIGDTGLYRVVVTNGNYYHWAVTNDSTLRVGELVREIYLRIPRPDESDRSVDVVVRTTCTTVKAKKKVGN